ncbi:MAG TPA: hypothetical protein VMT03_01705 [Polyangia bacterium]|nr:hypothetical protein [Polyangia bacterium]
MRRFSVLCLMALALSLTIGARAGAQAQRTDRPDAGPPLLDPNLALPTAGTEPPPPPGTPPPRALDSKRTPMPDRLALPDDMQNIPLAPPTPPIPPLPPNGGKQAQTGGGPKRVNQIFKTPPADQGPGRDIPRDSVTRTPEDQVPPTGSPP